jgi:NADH-quinone oxidoreductase subunit M
LWGGTNREYASIKFFLYTFLGSVFILIALIVIYLSSQAPDGNGVTHSFNLIYLSDPGNIIPSSLLDANSTWKLGPWGARQWLFLLLFVGFGIKLPVVPLHTWLPDAHVEAPTPVSIVLAALVLKVGAYGLIRFVFPLFPAEAFGFSHWIAGLAVLSIIYGALNAMACKDLKRLVAYSSVSHMGFVLLGIASLDAAGLNGAVLQMFNHGVVSAALAQ